MVNVLVVGAGITGATIARRYADDNHQVTVVDKRGHIAGIATITSTRLLRSASTSTGAPVSHQQ